MTSNQRRFAAIGECMIELSHLDDKHLSMGFAGDTYNVTLYLARYAKSIPLFVDYITALGDDPYSNMMLKAWQQEGIGVEKVQRLKGLMPGLYLIRNEINGERHFYFYRSQSAAKRLFYSENIQTLTQELLHYNYLYFSGISLAILDDPSRARLLDLLQRARAQGAIIIFDSNYRPTLWPDQAQAKAVMQQALTIVDIALVTFEDELKLFADNSPEATISRLRNYGVKEIVVKQGADGCLVAAQHGIQPVAGERVEQIVDTTAAGDSFNAAYLAARMQDYEPVKAAQFGNRLAATVIGYKGAIIPLEAMPKLF